MVKCPATGNFTLYVNVNVEVNMNKYVVVVEFLTSPNGLIFYMAHVFLVSPGFPQSTVTVQASVTASTPQQALAEGEFLAWLLCL